LVVLLRRMRGCSEPTHRFPAGSLIERGLPASGLGLELASGSLPNQMRFRLATWILILICCVAPSGKAQQTADVAYFETVRIKVGDTAKFKNTLKRHWGWHAKQGEAWSYFVWAVDTGKNEGAYEILSFGHTWKEVDESNALVAATPPPEEDPEPYHQSVQESYYRYRPELNIGSPKKQHLPLASVTYILLKPEALQKFEAALRRTKRSFPDGASVRSAQWYELVIGGDKPLFLLTAVVN
jgi:hypothetical protein